MKESPVGGEWRYWATPCVVAAVCVAFQLGGEPLRTLARYDRSALAAGELWRLLTGHLVHLSWGHLWPNLAALGLLTALVEGYATRREWLAANLASVAAIDLGLWTLDRDIEWYVGLSGMLHGLAAFAAMRLVQRRPAIGTALALGLSVKLLFEQWSGPLPFTASAAGGPVIVAAHLYGAAGGALAAAVIAAVRRRR